MTKPQCQVDENCPRKPVVTLIISCIEPHLTETLTCRTHLTLLENLHQQNKLYCHCHKHIITGYYKHGQAVRKLEDKET